MHSEDREILPKTCRPIHYDLELTPDLVNFTFTGVELVELDITIPTATIQFHCLDIQINSATIDNVKSILIVYDKAEESATVTFPTSLKGKKTLRLEFTGVLNDKMVGFYRSRYTVNGEVRYAATTQMEPTDARRAFPCWDEPALKATFTIHLIVPSHLTALSNMPEIERKQVGAEDSKLHRVSFAKTPVMSTYLVAFVIGEYDYVESSVDNIKVRVYTPLGKKQQGEFALNVATRTLAYFASYFDIAYPLPKADMIAVDDFSAGAMENWGLITYRSTALLVDPEHSGLSARQRVAYVVAHELAHQWFGNLVTMDWWRDLWLNEGFATFIGTQAVHYLFPEWDVWQNFVTSYFTTALKLDQLETTHPIQVDIRRSVEVNEIFDAISYNKGSCVIRMVSAKLGDTAFQAGLRTYLKRHQYSNAETEDLWAALSEASSMPVAEFMSDWTKSAGYPYLTVHLEDNELHVSQARFLANGKHEAGLWWCSVGVLSEGRARSEHELKSHEATLVLASTPAWLKINPGQTAFYRVRYSDNLLTALTAHLSELSPVDRLAIQDDLFSLTTAGLDTAARLLHTWALYANETDYAVWSSLAGNMGQLASLLPSTLHPHYRRFTLSLFSAAAERVGWQTQATDGPLQPLLRALLLARVGSAGHIQTVTEARTRLAAYVKDPASLAPDLQTVVFNIVAQHGSDEDIASLYAIYDRSDLQEEKVRLIEALSLVNVSRLPAALDFVCKSGRVRDQDMFIAFAGTSKSDDTRRLAWTYFKENWDFFNAKFGEGQMLFARMISYLTQNFGSAADAAEVKAFFATHPAEQAARTIAQSIEKINNNARFLDSQLGALQTWFTTNFS